MNKTYLVVVVMAFGLIAGCGESNNYPSPIDINANISKNSVSYTKLLGLDDNYTGVFTKTYANGVKKVVPFKNGKLNGTVKSYKNDQLEYTEKWQNNNILQKDTYIYGVHRQTLLYKMGDDYHFTRIIYDNSEQKISTCEGNRQYKLDGKCILHWPDNSAKMISYYKNDVMDGVREQYYENHQLQLRDTFKNGKQQGDAVEYYDTGELSKKLNFVDGQFHGKAAEFYKNGTVKSKLNYVHGDLDGINYWYYETGKLEIHAEYHDGQRDGMTHWYYETGKLYSKVNYIDGKKQVIQKWYYETGELHNKVNFIDNKKEGPQIWYDKRGKQTGILYYVNGISHRVKPK